MIDWSLLENGCESDGNAITESEAQTHAEGRRRKPKGPLMDEERNFFHLI